MTQESQNINCPQCGFAIDVNDILYHQLDAELQKKYNDDLAQEKKKFDDQQKVLRAERETLESDKAKLDEQVAERVKVGLSDQKKAIQEKIKKPLAEQLLFGGLQGGGHIFITVRDGELVVESDEKELEGANAL